MSPAPKIEKSLAPAQQLAAELSSLNLQSGGENVVDVPARYASKSQKKRSDPFQFGSRVLEDGDDVFEHNAWDHAETDAAYEEYALQQYELQRQSPVSDFDKERFNSDPAKWWNLFYKNNTANFFKDRKWLHQEFPILDTITREDYGPATLLEIGAGAGNTAFPVLAQNKNPQLRLHACDFSKQAVKVMRESESYDAAIMQADVWDVAGDSLPPGLAEGSVDVVVMVFVFSALAPSQWDRTIENVHSVLKPGGQVLFRDYGRGDLAQVRFRKARYLDENFYIRGDGTRVYFLDKDQLAKLWSGAADEQETVAASAQEADGRGREADQGRVRPQFIIENIGVDRRLLVNRKRKLKMHRCWLQGCFRKE